MPMADTRFLHVLPYMPRAECQCDLRGTETTHTEQGKPGRVSQIRIGQPCCDVSDILPAFTHLVQRSFHLLTFGAGGKFSLIPGIELIKSAELNLLDDR